jgi:hypothetical protein
MIGSAHGDADNEGEWTGLLDQYGNRINKKRIPIGFVRMK